jgi:hypothetical protein
MKTLLLIAAAVMTQVAQAQAPASEAPEEKVFECIGDITTGKKAPFREMVVVTGSTARVTDVKMELTPDNSPDYFNYVANLGRNVYQLTLFRKTGRFKYSTFIRKLQVAEGDCKKVERSKVFE